MPDPVPAHAKYPFQASFEELNDRIDELVISTVGSLSSFYLELPRGENFLDYEPFEAAHTLLHDTTKGFANLDRHLVHEAVRQNGLVLVVLRCMVDQIRRNDMKKLLLATRGKVFTVETMPYLIEQTNLRLFAAPFPGDTGGRGN
jgi:hypothetical protein